jgi:hypothetical protein
MKILASAEIVGRSLVRKFFPRKLTWDLDYDPYDKLACARIAKKRLEEAPEWNGSDATQACKDILSIIGDSYPTKALADIYFDLLKIVLSNRPMLERSGRIVIGIGPGRCGSTSLAAMLSTVINSCSTHETPPPIFWQPENAQIAFHIKRFRMLSRYYSLVSDVSHWWLNAIEQVVAQFPDAKIIGLVRDPDECALSFMRIQGFGKGSFNPWATRGNGLWRAGHWDPTYPSYPLPGYARKNPDRAKLELITNYVAEYNTKLREMANTSPDRVTLIRTEDLGMIATQELLREISGSEIAIPAKKLNVKKTDDGIRSKILL